MGRQHPGRCLGPKIVDLLARPEAGQARVELALCEQLQVSPSTLRGRPSITHYEHDEHGRVIKAVTTSPWTAEDRSLMVAWRMYKATLCPGCGHPKATAWHPDNDGWFEEQHTVTCHPCTIQRGRKDENGVVEPVEYTDVVDTRDYESLPLPPL